MDDSKKIEIQLKINLEVKNTSIKIQEIIKSRLDEVEIKGSSQEDKDIARYAAVSALSEVLGIMISHSKDYGLNSTFIDACSLNSLIRGEEAFLDLKKQVDSGTLESFIPEQNSVSDKSIN